MDARLNYPGTAIATNFGKYLNSAGEAVTESTLPAATQELVKIPAQRNSGPGPLVTARPGGRHRPPGRPGESAGVRPRSAVAGELLRSVLGRRSGRCAPMADWPYPRPVGWSWPRTRTAAARPARAHRVRGLLPARVGLVLIVTVAAGPVPNWQFCTAWARQARH